MQDNKGLKSLERSRPLSTGRRPESGNRRVGDSIDEMSAQIPCLKPYLAARQTSSFHCCL